MFFFNSVTSKYLRYLEHILTIKAVQNQAHKYRFHFKISMTLYTNTLLLQQVIQRKYPTGLTPPMTNLYNRH